MFPQSTILDPIFWMVLGALQVWVFSGAKVWAKDLDIPMSWWKWSITSILYLTIMLTIAGAFTLLGENEGNAGWYFLGFVGTILVILSALWVRILLVLKARMA
ncbi:hypothetical protein [Thaumasiovibrio sp. DFM-14]|uniref:hypothetical protein n=1 Tax=Thaumasiovibrio sp. DFM-14 TaxID=3384792 RepID=UPI0039A398BF